MEAINNPYQTPSGQLATDDNAFGEISFFSPSARIGRLRYLAHGFLLMLASYALLAAVGALAFFVSGIFWVLVGAAYLAMIVVTVILLIQRLHDLNHAGWWCLLMFVPLVNFIFILYVIFAPGTKGANNYGLRPPPNKTWHWVLGLMMPVIAMLGIVAAIALPAYVQYTERAAGIDASKSYQYLYDDYDDGEDDE